MNKQSSGAMTLLQSSTVPGCSRWVLGTLVSTTYDDLLPKIALSTLTD